MVLFIKTLQVILALSVLIIIHEFGHFLWARAFKIRVEKFYLFFDLGGTSLTVTSVLVEANEQGLEVSYGDIFDYIFN